MEILQEQIKVQQNVPSVVASMVSVVQCWSFHLRHILVELYDTGSLHEPFFFLFPSIISMVNWTFHSTDLQVSIQLTSCGN